jgi:uncharacterized protein YqjF (DUF2071 family)
MSLNDTQFELADPQAKNAPSTGGLSEAAKQRLLANRGEPLFLARWNRAVFIHYEAEPNSLQRCVPFELDLCNGRAFVSIVAFTLLRMRPRIGGRIGEWLLKPIATHGFLNVRTYVQHNGEPGIYFLAEWLSNVLAVHLGPRTFGLPYRFGHLNYEHNENDHGLRGSVRAKQGRLAYHGDVLASEPCVCDAESLNEFLLERYTAFTEHKRRRRFFRVWHPPWLQLPVDITVSADDLMAATGDWWLDARKAGATYSPGVDVWMGRPHRIA